MAFLAPDSISLSAVDVKDLPISIAESDLIVNATPLGTKEGDKLPFSPEDLKQPVVLYDLVYAHETEIVKKAKEKGIVSSNGLGMLINQAAVAFNIWTGKPIEEIKKVMQDAARK